MKNYVKLSAALALSLPVLFGSPASAVTGAERPVSGPNEDALTADAVHDAVADAALQLEQITGITDPSAPR